MAVITLNFFEMVELIESALSVVLKFKIKMSNYNNYTEEEEEEAYYRYIQEKLEQEERAKRQAAAQQQAPQPKEKVVSLGISSRVNPSPRDADFAKYSEKQDKFAKYRSQMEDDQRRVIEESRKPFVRKTYDDEPVEQFAIGKYNDPNSVKREKRESQLAYMRQLQADQQGKPLEVTRKTNTARFNPPPSNNNTGFLDIGRDEEYDKIAKRRAAIEVQIRNNEAIQAKLSEGYGSPNKLKKEPLYDLNRGNDQRAFENADYHFIGEREGDAKARKHQNANAYMQQLNAGKIICRYGLSC